MWRCQAKFESKRQTEAESSYQTSFVHQIKVISLYWQIKLNKLRKKICSMVFVWQLVFWQRTVPHRTAVNSNKNFYMYLYIYIFLLLLRSYRACPARRHSEPLFWLIVLSVFVLLLLFCVWCRAKHRRGLRLVVRHIHTQISHITFFNFSTCYIIVYINDSNIVSMFIKLVM